MKWIDGKTVIITGATSGIGRELTKLLILKNGCRVIGIGRREEKFLELLEELGDFASNFEYRIFDVSVEDNWRQFSQSIKDRDISIIINNAGVLPKFSSFEKMQETKVDVLLKTIDINFNSIVYSTYYIAPIIEKSQTPAIINICSSSALCPLAGMTMYTASKSATKNFTEALSLEKKYYVGLVCPGFTKTEIFKNQGVDIDGIVARVSTPLDKMSKKIYKGILRKKKRMVLGFDAKIMDFGYRLFPKTTTKMFTGILKKSKLKLFDDVFKENKKERQ